MSTNKIKERQRKILSFIEDYTAEHRCPPTIREVKRFCGIASTSTVFTDLKDLEDENLVDHIGTRYAPVYSEEYINKIANAISKVEKSSSNA